MNHKIVKSTKILYFLKDKNLVINYGNNMTMVMRVWWITLLSRIFQLYRGGQWVEETEVHGENHRPAASQLSYNVVSSTPRHEQDSNSQL